MQWLHDWRTPDNQIFASCWKNSSEDFVLNFADLADFHISNRQRSIQCYAEPGSDVSTIRHLLIDQVIPRILGHRGALVLHASATLVNGAAVAFMGESGLGKSTLAAYLDEQGYPLLTDDCFAIKLGTKIYLTPNYSGVRLFDDSANQLTGASRLRPVANYTTKQRIRLSSEDGILLADSWPLAAVFFLGPINQAASEPVVVSPAPGVDKMMGLVKNSFDLHGWTKDQLRNQYLQQARLSSANLPFFRLDYLRQYCQLPAVMDAVVGAIKGAIKGAG